MHYDPIKDRLAALAEGHPLLWRGFYAALDTLFLRAWYVRREVRRLMDALPRERPVHVLDAGTGFGQYVHFLLRNFPQARVHAVDVKPDYLARAEHFMRQTPHASRVAFAQDDLTRLEAEGPFDLILSVDVMEHIEEDEAAFRNFARVLRPGGYVVINTPSDRGGSGVEAGHTTDSARVEGFIGEHVRDGYNLHELEDKLRGAGLAPERSRYTYGPYGAAAWRLLIQQPMRALGKSWAFLPLVLLYYLPALPTGLLLNALDVRSENDEGTGLLITARKPPAAMPAA